MVIGQRLLVLLVILLPALVACGEVTEPPSAPSSEATTAGPLAICTTFYPLTYFTRRIAAEDARVTCPVPENEDPALWMPDDASIRRLQVADLVVANGASYESWLRWVSLAASRLVVTSRPFSGDLITYPQAMTHSHGPSGSHTHEGIDGHTWMDPELAKLQAGEILGALTRRLPSRASAMRRRHTELCADLDRLAADLGRIGTALGGRTLLASHPAYGYIARRFGWKIVLFSLDPAGDPPPERLVALRERAREEQASIILWESEPSPALRQRVRAEAGLTSVVFSTCETLDAASRRDDLDYMSRMHRSIEALEHAIAAGAGTPPDPDRSG